MLFCQISNASVYWIYCVLKHHSEGFYTFKSFLTEQPKVCRPINQHGIAESVKKQQQNNAVVARLYFIVVRNVKNLIGETTKKYVRKKDQYSSLLQKKVRKVYVHSV